jgi:hypothetical protein
MSVDHFSRELEAEIEDGRSNWEDHEASGEGTNGISDYVRPDRTIHTSQDVLELLRDVAISAPSPLPPIVVSREPWPCHLYTEGTPLDSRHPRVKLPPKPNTKSGNEGSKLADCNAARREMEINIEDTGELETGSGNVEPDDSHQAMDAIVGPTNEENELHLKQDKEESDLEDDHDMQVPDGHVHPRNTFLGLPAELRLIIYEFALLDNIALIVSAPSSLVSQTPEEMMQAWEELQPLPFLGGLA